MTEQHECEWELILGRSKADCKTEGCPKKLYLNQIETRLNEYETLKEELAQIKHDSQRLLNAVVCSPFYHKVKDTYRDLKRAVDILEGK